MIAWFTEEGIPHPVRFKIGKDESSQVIKIKNVRYRSEEKFAGNKMLIFRCQGVVNDALREFELKYELETCKWFLFKI